MEMVGEIGTRSDHCAWAHIIQEWRFGDMKQRELCRKLGLSFERMCSSMFERKHLMESLMQVGLLPTSFKDDEIMMKDKMPDWSLVKAAVVGGLYPNIVNVERRANSGRYQTGNFGDKAKLLQYAMMHRSTDPKNNYRKSVYLHPNSLMFGYDQFHTPWLAFYTIQQTTKLYAYDVSEASPFALLLFGQELTYNKVTHSLQVGGFASFRCRGGEQLMPLLQETWMGAPELQVCIQLLRCNGLGFQKPDPKDFVRTAPSEAREFNEHENETAFMMRKAGLATVAPMVWRLGRSSYFKDGDAFQGLESEEFARMNLTLPRGCQKWKSEPHCCKPQFFKKISATTVVEDLNFVRDQYANFKEDGMKRDTSTLHRPTVVTILMWLQREKGVAVWVSIRKPFACLLVPGHHR
eukprot:g22395.t1